MDRDEPEVVEEGVATLEGVAQRGVLGSGGRLHAGDNIGGAFVKGILEDKLGARGIDGVGFFGGGMCVVDSIGGGFLKGIREDRGILILAGPEWGACRSRGGMPGRPPTVHTSPG